GDMQAAYAPTTYSVVVEFESESYWHLHTVGYKPVIPKHIFEGTNSSDWNLWNPDPPTEAMVTSGPFNVSEFVAGEFTELTYNPNYFFGQNIPIHYLTTTETEPSNNVGPGLLSLTSNAITGVSLCVIVIVLTLWKLETSRIQEASYS
ncbi:MAG: hypothetical protein ACFFF4_16225, partial [Candidatus Thorarchaeota archaeon]